MNRYTSIRFTRLGIAILVLTGMLITLFVNVAPIHGQQTSDQITVSPLTGLVTTETNGTDTFTIVLNSVPTADVTIALSSSNTAEGTVSPANLTFTSLNWSTPQIVTVTGVDDDIDDGDIAYQIVTALAVSTDAIFNGQDASDVGVTNTDNDTAGITVSQTAGLVTTEAGVADTFTVVLNSQPTASVTIGLTSSDTTEGTVSPDSLTFTSGNWNNAQTITVTGVDDLVADGAIIYTIITTNAASGDPAYTNMIVDDVAVTNLNDDSAGITVFPTSDLTTTEGNGTDSFTVVLTSQPTANVTIALTSSDLTEGTVSPASLTFTSGNWNESQTVTVTGVNDFIIDGPVAYTIVTAQATGGDMSYNTLNPADVSVTNTDNDAAGFTVTPTSGLVTTEVGGTASFTVVLTSQPNDNVTIGITSNDATEGSVAPTSLVFTNANWNTPRTVTVTGVDDAVVDGNVEYTIITAAATSTDGSYSGVNPPDVSVTNTDNDAAGITVTPTSGLVTTEAGGTASFTVVLTSQPTDNVTIGISSNDATEGSVAPTSLVFTSGTWSIPQTVIVTGLDDTIADGNVAYTIITAAATSLDGNYSGRDAANVAVTNTDNDAAGITVTPTSGLVTTEVGGTSSFTVVLTSQPTDNVTIGISSNDATEGSVAPTSLVFTSGTWSIPQTVVVTGLDDTIADGNVAYTIITAAATSTDGSYSGVNPPDVSVTNTDNDAAGITVTPTSGLVTTEAGGTASFTVVLTSQPTGNVTIGVSSSNTNEGTVSTGSLVFTNLNWNVAQTVIVTGANDFVVDGNVSYTIVTAAATSTDGSYSGVNPPDVSVTNTDNDAAGITVTAAAGLTTTEAGGTATFTVVLGSQPTGNVTIGVSSSNINEGTVSPTSLVFTNLNWNVAQTVTVTGVNDSVADGNVAYTIITAAATSTDGSYNGVNPPDVAVTNTDNDVAGFILSATSGLVTTEAGGSATFTIRLNSQPTADVLIGLSSSDTGEGTVLPVSVTFTSLNWSTPQTVTVTGANDSVVDGTIPYTIVTAAASTTDLTYSGLNPADVSVTNTDNDVAGITVSPTTGLITTEPTGTTTFTVVLNSQPAANVTIGLSSNDTTEGTVSPASLVFTAANWNIAQTITITVVDDLVADGNVGYSIITAQAVSSDGLYSVINPPDVSVTNQDNDVAGITVNPTSGLNTSEAGGTATFTVVLTSQPTANVTIGLSSSDTTEGTVLPASLLFTTANWSTAQTVTVTGVNDFVADGPITYTITTAAATSTDAGYNNRNAANVTVINQDNDTAGFTVNPTSGLVTTEAGGTATFTVVLNTQPTANVTIALSSSDITEGTVTPASLTFTNANWNVVQTVTVKGVDDPVAERPADDGNQPYNIITGNASSTDAIYNNMVVSNVSVTNTNNDFRPVAVSDSYQTNAKPGQPLNKSAPGVLSNDTDANNDPLTASLVNGPTKGTLTLSTNGGFVYTPASAYPTLQTDSFTYRAHDGQDPSLDPPARVDIVIDPIAPTIQWDGDFSNGEIYHVGDQYMLLTVDASDNYSISQVRFLRWDAVNNKWVDIGVVTNSPYQWNLDTSTLNFFWNQVYVFVSDGAGNSSNQYIWLYRDLPYRLYMPKVGR